MGAVPSNKPDPGCPAATMPFAPSNNFHNMTTAAPAAPKQPRLRASCDGCFLAKVKCTKSRPVCSRCLSVGLVCRYSPSSRSLGNGSRGREERGGDSGRKGRARRNGGTSVLASTMSEESCVWLGQYAQQGGMRWLGHQNGSAPTASSKLTHNEAFQWEPAPGAMLDQSCAPTLNSEMWMTPENQGWIQFGYHGLEGTMDGDLCLQSLREANSSFGIASSEGDPAAPSGFISNHSQWAG